MYMKKLLLFLTVFVLCSCNDVMVSWDEIVKEQEQEARQEQDRRNQVISEANPIHIMHAIGVLDAGCKWSASISVTYFLCADSSVVVVKQKGVTPPYSIDEARLIMLKELELQKKKK